MCIPHGRFLYELPAAADERLLDLGRERTIPVGELIYTSDVLLVLEGTMAVAKTQEQGRELLTSFRGEGGLIGENVALAQSPEKAPITLTWAVTTSTVAVFHEQTFRRFLQNTPSAWEALALELADRLEEAETRLASVAAENADRRLARFLLTMPGAYRAPAGLTVDRMSKADLADWVGVRRETIERRLQKWRERHIVTTGYRRVTIVDVPALAAIAGISLEHDAELAA